MAASKFSRQNEDFFSNAPDIVTDKILELLPIREAARTSVLSKQWKRNWLSLKSLVFDEDFCEDCVDEDGSYDPQECNSIVNSILLYHNGPVHDFSFYIRAGEDKTEVNLGQWLSFLSKNGVRRIIITNWSVYKDISSHLFWCSELVHLELFRLTLNPPPIDFNGFPKLQELLLIGIQFSQPDVLCSLMANCPMLATLILGYFRGIDHIVIDVPSLKTLSINGQFESLAFKDVHSLESITVFWKELQGKPMAVKTVDAINLLASSCQLQCIDFGGDFCKFLAVGGMTRSLPVAFNHLNKISLYDLDLGDASVLCYIFRTVESCRYIKELYISVSRRKNANQHKPTCNNNVKIDRLLEVKIEGITGTSAELNLIEYLLANSSVLEKLFFKCGAPDTESELKLLRVLTGFPRASPKARLVCLT